MAVWLGTILLFQSYFTTDLFTFLPASELCLSISVRGVALPLIFGVEKSRVNFNAYRTSSLQPPHLHVEFGVIASTPGGRRWFRSQPHST